MRVVLVVLPAERLLVEVLFFAPGQSNICEKQKHGRRGRS